MPYGAVMNNGNASNAILVIMYLAAISDSLWQQARNGSNAHLANPAFASTSSLGDSILLIIALCFHSVFEGIAIGIAENKDDAYKALWTISQYDGVFRHYAYPKNNGSRTASWPNSWSVLSLIPPNMCLMGQDLRTLACGLNSYCTNQGRKSCHCPLGYSFIDPVDAMKGCKQDFVSQSCDEASPETDLFDFNEMPNTIWLYSDYAYFESVTETWCRQACLADCFCAVAEFDGGKCWKKRSPLINGAHDPSIGGKTLMKIRIANSTVKSKDHKGKDDHSKLIIIGSVVLSGSVLLVMALLLATFLVAYWFGKRKIKVNQSCHFKEGMNLRSFTYQELSKATNEFKEEVGHGAFATVYRGVLLGVDRSLIAVKRCANAPESILFFMLNNVKLKM